MNLGATVSIPLEDKQFSLQAAIINRWTLGTFQRWELRAQMSEVDSRSIHRPGPTLQRTFLVNQNQFGFRATTPWIQYAVLCCSVTCLWTSDYEFHPEQRQFVLPATNEEDLKCHCYRIRNTRGPYHGARLIFPFHSTHLISSRAVAICNMRHILNIKSRVVQTVTSRC